MLELSVERALPHDFSVATSAGIGLVSQRRDDRDEKNESELLVNLLVGYKLALRSGFTFHLAAGAGFPTFSSIPRSDNAWIGLAVDSGVGWSF